MSSRVNNPVRRGGRGIGGLEGRDQGVDTKRPTVFTDEPRRDWETFENSVWTDYNRGREPSRVFYLSYDPRTSLPTQSGQTIRPRWWVLDTPEPVLRFLEKHGVIGVHTLPLLSLWVYSIILLIHSIITFLESYRRSCNIHELFTFDNDKNNPTIYLIGRTDIDSLRY